jgi:hypothetical protein
VAYYAYQANYTMSNETLSYQLALNLMIKWINDEIGALTHNGDRYCVDIDLNTWHLDVMLCAGSNSCDGT